MASINYQKGIELLKKQAERGRALLAAGNVRSNGHESWENTARVFLEKYFGKDTDAVNRFLKKAKDYELSIWNLDSLYESRLQAQLAYLGSCIEILEGEIDQYQKPDNTHTAKKIIPIDASGDPLKRRYQVFVSSTYEDLKEERRHIIQALLQTKCIPTGMELFPAASEEKWELIKRIIDDCDYYTVIIAGRYGSIGLNGKSFTEMEFDYAVSSGKSVMGFYHSDIESLPLSKSEKNDTGRKHLAEFAEKVKRVQSCASWNTPEGLASAIKSAMIHAIENDPKPGWIRALDVASPEAIANLKKSVKRSDSGRQEDLKTNGKSAFSVRATILYWESDSPPLPRLPWEDRKSHQCSIQLDNDELFLLLGSRLTTRRPRKTLKMFLEERLAQQIKDSIPKAPDKHYTHSQWEIETDHVQRILDTFVAQKLLKVVQPPKGLSIKVPYWEITAKGQQRLAELRAAISE